MATPKDRKRFERIMLVHLDASYNLALWLLRDPSEAEDIVQTAYMKAFDKFSTFQGGNSTGWILTIVRNTAYNWLKKQKNNSNLISFEEALHGGENGESVRRDTMNPEEVISAIASHAQMMRCMDSLAVEFREVLFLRELEGCSYKEIAEIIQVPKGTVMSRLSRAREQLKKIVVDQKRRKKVSRLST